MFYALVALDKPNALHKRLTFRPQHLAYLESLGEQLILAGPFLDDKGDMVGSIVVIDAESYEAAESTFRQDPFMFNGVFDQITIKPWKVSINKLSK